MNTIIEDGLSALSGLEFQKTCDRLLLKLFPQEYTPTRSGGPNGDMGNDGYCIYSRIFFTAYGAHQASISKIKNKLRTDVAKVIEKQKAVDKIVFLTNQAFVGEVELEIDNLRRKYPIEIESWGHQRLASIIQQFTRYEIEQILRINFPRIDLNSLHISYKIDESSIEPLNYSFILGKGIKFLFSMAFVVAIPYAVYEFNFNSYLNLIAPLPLILIILTKSNRRYVLTWLRSFMLKPGMEGNVDGESFVFKTSSEKLILFQRVAKCVFPYCNGIVRVHTAPERERIGSRLYQIGVCNLDNGHTYTYNNDGNGYFRKMDFRPISKDEIK